MKPTSLVVTVGLFTAAGATAHAGGLFLPGAGAESTSRAGASLAAADDGEALAINPAGLAKAHNGTEITVSAAIINYVMSFTRAGTYDTYDQTQQQLAPADDQTYVGQKFPTVSNTSKPPLGIGSYQPVPVVAITSDLGGIIKGLRVAAGLYAPNAYPFRDMTVVNGKTFVFNSNFDQAPPPTRYDIEKQEAAVIVPSIAAGYHINDYIDVGARFGLAFANLKSTVALWGVPDNYSEWVKEDGQVSLQAKENAIPSYSLGATVHPTHELEIAVNYTSAITINAKGTAQSENGPEVSIGVAPVVIVPTTGMEARCAPNSLGTPQALNACVGIALPQSAQIGGRYKFLDNDGKLRGDIELDLDWENWGKNENDYTVTIDAAAATANNLSGGIPLKDSVIYHGFQDTYGVRLGGSYVVSLSNGDDLIIRGGAAYDTAAAKPGWERADIDGAARTTLAAGVGYKMRHVQIDAGFGLSLEGTRTNPNSGAGGTLCNPTSTAAGCVGTNMDQAQADRHGPDPTNPLIDSSLQTESPVNQGTFSSHYVMFMLGAKTWF